MIFHAGAFAPEWFAERVFDVCVIGTGPAEPSLARRLAHHGSSVALMDGGGTELSFESQDLV